MASVCEASQTQEQHCVCLNLFHYNYLFILITLLVKYGDKNILEINGQFGKVLAKSRDISMRFKAAVTKVNIEKFTPYNKTGLAQIHTFKVT